MIADVSGSFSGRKNDHWKQNEGRLSQRLVDCQIGNAVQCDTNCDKGYLNLLVNYFLAVHLMYLKYLFLRFSSTTLCQSDV